MESCSRRKDRRTSLERKVDCVAWPNRQKERLVFVFFEQFDRSRGGAIVLAVLAFAVENDDAIGVRDAFGAIGI